MKTQNLTCELFRNLSPPRSWRWRVRAKNGKLVAKSGEGFVSKRNARRGWNRFEEGVIDGYYEWDRIPIREIKTSTPADSGKKV